MSDAATNKEVAPLPPPSYQQATAPQTPPPPYSPGTPVDVQPQQLQLQHDPAGCMSCGSPAISYEFDCCIICLLVCLFIFGTPLLGFLFCLIAKRQARCRQCCACGIACNVPRAVIN